MSGKAGDFSLCAPYPVDECANEAHIIPGGGVAVLLAPKLYNKLKNRTGASLPRRAVSDAVRLVL
jgi:hypothetical protein